MNHIIIDLEFNSPYISKKGIKIKNNYCPFEIMELGAIKLDENLKQIDTFRIFVKPVYYQIVAPIVCRKTGITIDDLKMGFDFPKALNVFLKWLEEDYMLYTWSENDYIVMKQNCKYHKITNQFFESYIDIQQLYKKFTNSEDVIALDKVLKHLRIPVTKNTHTGLADAMYTAEILKYINGISIKTISDKLSRKESDEKNYKRINCPVCGKFAKKTCETKGFNKNKKHTILAKCDRCNVYIKHTIQREFQRLNIYKYYVEDDVIKEKEYNGLKETFIKRKILN